MARVSVKGLIAARKAFQALPQITQDAINEANEETAELIRAGAARRVPVRYGLLLNFIATKLSKRSGFALVGIQSGAATTPTGKTVRPAWYAHFAEYGTVHETAHPFMVPSLLEQEAAHLRRVKDKGPKIERNMANVGLSFE